MSGHSTTGSTPTVLFIAGWGRSGSTLLTCALGQCPGTISVGETRDIWRRGVVENRACGCGVPFWDCSFWSAVGEAAFGGWQQLDVDEIHGLRRSVDRPWRYPSLRRASAGRSNPGSQVARYEELVLSLYRAIADVSGAKVVIDSSKIATYGLILRSAGLPVRAIHLVRDSRGVIHSWRKTMARGDQAGRMDQMIRYGTASASVRYLLYNSMASDLGGAGIPTRRVRYEDLVARPALVVPDLCEFAELSPSPEFLDRLTSGQVHLEATHTVDGNPMRFQTGDVTLDTDDAWRTHLPAWPRRFVTAVTSPLLARYDYLGSAPAVEDGPPAGAADRGRATGAPVVIYIGGSGRSGSTLLDRMLGQISGLCSTGELARLWDLGLRDNQLCGCGEPVRSCPFWTEVGNRAFGGWDRLDLGWVLALHAHVRRHRNLPLLLAGAAAPGFRRKVNEYTGLLTSLYTAIAEVSGCPVVVDSSKEPAYAFLVREAFRSDVRLVHLVRDSRGVAFSWTKRVLVPDQPERYLPRYNPARMALRWVGYNAVLELLPVRPSPTMLLRYEDLVADPDREVSRVLDLVGDVVSPGLPVQGEGRQVHLAASHTVAGNPMRFSQGATELKVDDAWRTGMPRRQRMAVSALSAPALVRYGYLARRSPAKVLAGR